MRNDGSRDLSSIKFLMRLGRIVLDRVGELSGASKRYPEYGDGDDVVFQAISKSVENCKCCVGVDTNMKGLVGQSITKEQAGLGLLKKLLSH